MTAMTTEVLGLPRGRPLTRADLAGMPDDGHRYELIDGVLIVSPAPRIRHQVVAGNLFSILRAAAPAGHRALFAPVDVVLGDDTVLQPDLIVAADSGYTANDLPGPPLLAVEILSPSTRAIDLFVKKHRLARAGCPHYWVIDPDEPSITAWTLTGGEYMLAAEASGTGEFHVDEPFAVTTAPADLLR